MLQLTCAKGHNLLQSLWCSDVFCTVLSSAFLWRFFLKAILGSMISQKYAKVTRHRYPGAEIVKAKCGKGSATLSLGAG